MTEQALPLTVAVIVGSVRRPRVGRAVAEWFAGVGARTTAHKLDVIDLAEVDLPLDGTRPGGCHDSPIAGRLAAADAFAVVTPEYNHSYPAALKNAIDWHYRQWMFKPVTFVSYGAGSGGVRAVEHLRLVFAELHAATTRHGVVLNAPWERLGPQGALDAGPGAERAAETALRELTWWGGALKAARVAAPFEA
ncbi:NAD(P)H-dependent oxidoreductase [Dactylosporangium sp. AC04546]|uniref:NADPH-dependent FMN reductase n=1 Tax=Dactylosporangium sp. AC04546 TaxID=2862460 RepID=UPI001EDEDB82|nr:NAD(P)H-dependent oxidoreductase [Dactylosporangium sp. AC04546]WVK79993.1 NAD(P)H-dependent oxidoreductase [Dactylosporangium sp. AC04546]